MIGSVFAVWPKTLSQMPRIFPLLLAAIFFSFFFSGVHAAYLLVGSAASAFGASAAEGPTMIFGQLAAAIGNFFVIGAALIALRMLLTGESIRSSFDLIARRGGDMAVFALLNTVVAFVSEWGTRQLYLQHMHLGWNLAPVLLRSVWTYFLLRALTLCSAESVPAFDAFSRENEIMAGAPSVAFVLWLPLLAMRVVFTFLQTSLMPMFLRSSGIASKEIYFLAFDALFQILLFVELTYGAAIYLARPRPEPEPT